MTLIYWLWCYLLAPLLYPLTNFLLPINFLWFRNRKVFEELNEWDESSISFRQTGEVAQVTLEVSSEGELEQVRPLISYWLQQNYKIELIYCSPSVEAGMQRLYRSAPEQIRLFRLPLLIYWPFSRGRSVASWMTSSVLILCRYDFFPELMLVGMKKKVRFILVSATLKDKMKVVKRFWDIRRHYWHFVYHAFDSVWVSTPADKDRLVGFLNFSPFELSQVDFRVLQIAERLEKSEMTLKAFPFFVPFREWLEKVPMPKRLVMGSFWPEEETAILETEEMVNLIMSGEILVTIVPHQLRRESIEQKIKKLPLYFLSPELTREEIDAIFKEWKQNPGVVVLLFKGILCELYSLFGNAYVGGGFGRSVHSVLEPYLGGCRMYVGPKVYRSTEYDLVKQLSPNDIHLFTENRAFYETYKGVGEMEVCREYRHHLIEKMKPRFKLFVEQVSA